MAVAIHSEERTVSVWNVSTKECIWETSPHKEGAVLAMAWSADGRKLATVGRDFKVCVFKPQMGGDALLVVSFTDCSLSWIFSLVASCNYL